MTQAITQVAIHRDGWDVAQIWITFIAGGAAIIAIWTWIAQQRATPEVRFSWHLPDDPAGTWNSDAVFVFEPGRTYELRAEIRNVGKGTGLHAIGNFSTPKWMRLEYLHRDGTTAQLAQAVAPDGRETHYVVPRMEHFFPALDWTFRFYLEVSTEPPSNWQAPYPLYLDVETEGLTASGRRLLPSVAFQIDRKDELFEKVDGPLRTRSSIRWIRALPRTVHCRTSFRRDVRRFVIARHSSEQMALDAGLPLIR